jgi:hypothetical protein
MMSVVFFIVPCVKNAAFSVVYTGKGNAVGVWAWFRGNGKKTK